MNIMKTATIFDSPRTSTRRLGLQAAGIESTLVFPMLADSVPPCVEDDRTIRESQEQRQKTQAKTGLLPKLAARAHEKGLSLFEYLADLAPEDLGASRFLSLE
jgi:hypothetical protein